MNNSGFKRGYMVTRVSMQTLVDFGVRFLTKWGAPEDRALYLSQSVVEAEAFRQSTHGLAQFEQMNERLGRDIDPQAEPKVVRDSGATVLLDGEGCFGNLTMKLAKELAVRKAGEYGIGFSAVGRTEWVGALGTHLVSIVREGLLAMIWAQTNHYQDCAPYGGIDARLGTNPIAIAFPTEGYPVIADFSTATMSVGAAEALADKGARTPAPRFLDTSGCPSDDPAVVMEGGAMMLSGGDLEGYKFYALSLFNEALTVMAGGNANNPETPPRQSFSLAVLDPSAFAGSGYYLEEMKRFVGHLKSSRARPDLGGVRLPGERGFKALEDARKNGVPLDEGKFRMLEKIAEDNGIEPIRNGP